MKLHETPQWWATIYAQVEPLMTQAEAMFVAGMGSSPLCIKGPQDFATAVDLEIEAFLRTNLTSLTGFTVVGEELGGSAMKDRYTWIVDPVDGTTNFSTGSPLCGILVALLYDGEPIAAITSLPALRLRLTGALGCGVLLNGEPLEPRRRWDARNTQVIFGSMPRVDLVAALEAMTLRPRIVGSVGVSLAFTVMGMADAAVSFSPHLWDNAAGALLAREAGLRVTDSHGAPWDSRSEALVISVAEVHPMVVQLLSAQF